jgi:propanediol dehydratase small subunit
LLKGIDGKTSEILALVRELRGSKATTVNQDTLIAIARKIRPRVATREEALRELENAADIAADLMARRVAGSNVDAFVNEILGRLAEPTEMGR